MKYYLYNKLANNGIEPKLKEGSHVIQAVGLDYKKFVSELKENDEIVLVGGDGTVNYFVNEVNCETLKNNVYYLPAGTGNDFANDIGAKEGEEVLINEYIKDLPVVFVNGLERKFINGIGYGLDGYCCEEADRQKEKTPNKKINYTMIALKGLLITFKPVTATVEVDGKTHTCKNIWLSPAMKGRYYGGGMMIAPNQDRKEKQLTVVNFFTRNKLRALTAFPSVFEGKHVKYTKIVKFYTGKNITVTFDRPCALQIDGETVLNVKTYTVKA